ncbi:hypothetical protein PTSG_00251 [Salpingoeca rosetta]|uniref:Uncharacterized protein n=1 Tax=Salpingoeca rosetta (strain ATCC 50818 / BSB-021) TaxID=946362 RepID=F2TVY5_SALR5|nr:uncharacterized protein PTSG_00251 [Salpingoeca rosetta]EGD72231.1 hypothetical protein PTSG_00251 [Salpingoeca rosetta]|eukprot:XP_004998802.1 hypothetical protein PTSG_00251 [Salpingoeca rosetta]
MTTTQALIDGALKGATEEERLKCLDQLCQPARAAKLTQDNVEELSALLLATDTLFFRYSDVLLACPAVAVKALDVLRVEPVLSTKAVLASRIYGLLAAIGVANEPQWKECRRQLLASLAEDTGVAHAQCFRELRFLHGIQEQEPGFPYTAAAKFRPPTHTPDEDTLRVVKDAYLNGLLRPQQCGGYIDFLEESGIAVDPDDEAVQSAALNTWEGQYSRLPKDVLEEMGLHHTFEESQQLRETLHDERVEALREHWMLLHQKKRAETLSRALTKAIFIFIVYFILMWTYGYYAKLQEEQDGQ